MSSVAVGRTRRTRYAPWAALGVLALGPTPASAGDAGTGPPATSAPIAALDAGQPTGFRLEGRVAVDDVFGDAADYRRTIDRFLELSRQMSQLRDEFARAVQTTLTDLGARGPRPSGAPKRGCPVDAVAPSYARAHRLGGEYLRLGRELTRHHEQIREFDRLGESVGLTPDYRAKVRRVLAQYRALIVDYREMKVAFHDQLIDELHYASCGDLWALLQKGEALQSGDAQHKGDLRDEWPQPGSPGAPGVPALREGPTEAPPSTLAVEKVPPMQPIPVPKRTTDAPPTRSGILFYVDNTRCRRPSSVTLDGKALGEVAAGTRAGFQSQAGPHDLCLIDEAGRSCGQAGTIRRSYLHEGWTITLRCD